MFKGFKAYFQNPYDPITNPTGIINLGVAENKLLHNELVTKLNQCHQIHHHTMNYGQCPHGSPSLRNHLSNLFNRYFNPRKQVSSDHITVHNGVNPLLCNLLYTICDDGDGVIIPGPYYHGLDHDAEWLANVKVFDANMGRELVAMDVLEEAMNKAQRDGCKIRALIITNPGNPTGKCYTETELEILLRFAAKYSIHVISDEIYALSIHNPTTPFISLLSWSKLADIISPSLVHIVWGFSKDFCMNGLRCGVLVSENSQVLSCMRSLALVTTISNLTDDVLTKFLEDTSFVDWFLSENKKRLKGAYDMVTAFFKKLDIEFVEANGGFFVWLRLLQSHSKTESELFELCLDNGIFLTPGFQFHAKESGWCRIVFSLQNEKALETALERLDKILKQL